MVAEPGQAAAWPAPPSLLVALVLLVDRVPLPTPPGKRARGRPPVYPDRLFLKALVIMLVRHLSKVHTLLAVLAEPTPEMQQLRTLLGEQGRFPSRRTWERRLRTMPDTLPAQIGCLGRSLVGLLHPWATWGRAVAIDSTVLRAAGGVWHQKDRAAGVVPHTSIDTEAHWTKSGWHGWVYGWKLHLVSTAAAVWVPLAADLTAANVADNDAAPALLAELPLDARYVLGDRHYNAPNVHDTCDRAGRTLVATRYGPYPHTDGGVEVRRVFHKLRSLAIENFNEHFKGIFDCHGAVPTRGRLATRRFALGAVFLYQLALLHRFEHQLDLRVGLKAFLCAA
jgi:Transposase DDE domain